MLCAVQALDAFDLDHVGAGAAQIGAHRDQEFARGPASRARAPHFRWWCGRAASTAAIMMFSVAPDRRRVEPDARAGQPVGMRLDIAVAKLDPRAKRANAP